MTKIEFSDGVKFDVAGGLRIERRKDGLYVVGDGMLSPVDSYQEGRELIEACNKSRAAKPEKPA